MPKFAVYFVPQAEDELYRLGTSILGYDVRAGEPAQIPRGLKDRLGGFDQEWTKEAQPYAKLGRVFSDVFAQFSDIILGSICLLIQMNEDENWQIHKEFKC